MSLTSLFPLDMLAKETWKCEIPMTHSTCSATESPRTEYWIVNEDGQNIRITDGVGEDGCSYRREGDDTVIRLRHTETDETEITGEFQYHAKPFSLTS